MKKGLLILQSATLLFISSLIESDSQALTALRTAAGNDLAAILGSHAVQETVDAAALTLLGLKSSLHGCILRKNLSPVWGLMWSQIGDRLAIQQYIAHYGLLSSIFFAFLQTFLKNLCGETFNFFTHFPWKTFYPQYLVAFLRLGHKAVSQTQVCLFYVL